MSKANESVMRRFVEEVINNGNFSAVSEVIHLDYVYRSPDQEIHGSEGLKALIASYRAAFPDLNVNIDDLVADDYKVVISFILTGTHKGDLMGIAATDKPVKIQGMLIGRFEEGKIIEEWEILDQFTMFQQLGVVSFPA